MYYKKALSLLIMLCLALAANAQRGKSIPVWKIGYRLDFGMGISSAPAAKEDQEQKVMIELAKSLSGSSDKTPPLVCYVASNYLRIEQSGLGGGITIADKRDTISYLLDTVSKTATRYPAAMPDLHTQLAGGSMVVISSADFKMELKKDTMTIAGQLCSKAIFINPSSPENVITVWYTTALPRLYWQKYSYLKTIPGCALSIGTVTKGLNVGIKAELIEKMDCPKRFFQPPADYAVSDGLF